MPGITGRCRCRSPAMPVIGSRCLTAPPTTGSIGWPMGGGLHGDPRVAVAGTMPYHRLCPGPSIARAGRGAIRGGTSACSAMDIMHNGQVVYDRVYVATSPDLWVYEDKDGDLHADGPPQKLLTGFGGYNHDHGAHSLVLGPDHKWWMSHGDGGFDVTGTDGSHVKFQWGGVLRGELDGSQLETVAVNFRNPYEVCVNSFGEAFLSDNDNDGNESTPHLLDHGRGQLRLVRRPAVRQAGARRAAVRRHAVSRALAFPRLHSRLRARPRWSPVLVRPAASAFTRATPSARSTRTRRCTPTPARACAARIRTTLGGYGMQATAKCSCATKATTTSAPTTSAPRRTAGCTSPIGTTAAWAATATTIPTRAASFVLTPQRQEARTPRKAGPYDNVADAIEGLQSPNLATQYLARERLLAAGSGSVPALKRCSTDDEPNIRPARCGCSIASAATPAGLVVEQLQVDDQLAAGAGRAHPAPTRRANTRDAILAMADDPSDEVRREVLLAAQALKGEAGEQPSPGLPRRTTAAIAINSKPSTSPPAAEERRAGAAGRASPALAEQFPLLQLLAPERAIERLLAGNWLERLARTKATASRCWPAP